MATPLEEFYQSLYEEYLEAKGDGTFGSDADYFTNLMFDYLQEISEIDEDPIVYSYRGEAVQINGYEFADDKTMLRLFVTQFTDSPELINVSDTDVRNALLRCENIVKRSKFNKFSNFQKEHELYELCEQIFKALKELKLKDIRICFITNGLVKNKDFSNQTGAEIKYEIWDMDRLFKAYNSTTARDPINVDFHKLFGRSLPALRGGNSERASVYIAILPSEVLVKLYENYGDKLLERNVRAFLQKKGNVNKGIAVTIEDEPDMFLAYNNGITVTANEVVLEDGQSDNYEVNIKEIRDLQIVNGGQTTVSLYRAKIDSNYDVDFGKIFVQMKLAVVVDSNSMDDIVPKISLYSNSQNKIQTADFASNDPFHRELEIISRKTTSPSINGRMGIQWFYERARGQYANALNMQKTPSQRKKFKELNPLVTKTDLVKALYCWDCKPTIVSLGSQKCFNKFMENLSENPIKPDLVYYKNAIAKYILFVRMGKLVMQQKFGGYKANIVAYTYYKLMLLTEKRIDLPSIWEKQRLTPALENEIVKLCSVIRDALFNVRPGHNISEVAKTSLCEDYVRNLKYELSKELKEELLDEPVLEFDVKADEKPLYTSEEEAIIDEVFAISANEWQHMAVWAKENNVLTIKERSVAFKMLANKNRKQKPNLFEAKQAKHVHELFIEKGFRM